MATLPPTYVPGFHDPEVLKQIPYRRLGETDMMVSRLSFGCSSISHRVRFLDDATVDPNDPQLQYNIGLVREAVESGINYFDTSPFYGAGKSEIVLGHVLSRLPRQSYYVATKVGRNEDCLFNYSAEEVKRLVLNSLKKLQVTYIDVVQVHDVEFADSIDVVVNETLPALEELRKEGLIKYIGISAYPFHALKQVVERNDATRVRIDTVLSYCRHTLFNNDLLHHVDFFRQHKLGIINAAVHGMGLLTGSCELADWHPATDEVRSACRSAIRLCQAEGVSVSDLTTGNALSSEAVDMVLTGMVTKEILHANLRVLRSGLSAEEQRVLHRLKKECMSNITAGHWEGVELSSFKDDKVKFCDTLRELHGSA